MTITGYDMWVISRGLNLAPEQFIVVVPQADESAKGFLLDGSENKYNIALDKKKTDEPGRPCTFWLEMPGGIGRCGIYNLRPYVCQTYPANFMGSTVVQRREDVLCAPGAWRDGTLNRPVWRERLLRMYVESDIYTLAVARWNYHVLHTANRQLIDPAGYFAFLMKYYARLEEIRGQLDAEGWLAMCEDWAECLMENTSSLVSDLEIMAPWTSVVEGIHGLAADFFPDDTIDRAPDQKMEVVLSDA